MFRLFTGRYRMVTEITMRVEHTGPNNAEDELQTDFGPLIQLTR